MYAPATFGPTWYSAFSLSKIGSRALSPLCGAIGHLSCIFGAVLKRVRVDIHVLAGRFARAAEVASLRCHRNRCVATRALGRGGTAGSEQPVMWLMGKRLVERATGIELS